ncbi:cullin, partial [Helicosporidium sp. ATCC 50920]
LDALVAEALGGSEAFAGALREGFEHFINQKGGKPAELIARYMDGLMRGGGAGKGSEEEVEAALDAALALFRFIQGKDVFEAFYKKDLAKRLLLSRSVSVETEKAAIAKLKVECGSQFTTKLEGMFKDVELSRDVCAGFRAEETTLDLQGLDLHVNILTSGFWPSYPSSPCELPPALARAQEGFSDYYLHKHSGRRLVWQDALSSCVLRARFDCGVRELSVSLFQAVVLLQFEADQGRAGREEEALRGGNDAGSSARGADPGSSDAAAGPSSDASSSGPGEPPPAPAPGW